MRSKWRKSGRWAVLGTVVSSVVALSVAAAPAGATQASSATAGSAARAATGSTLSTGTTVATGPSKTVTLITGDQVRLTGDPGHQTAQIIKNVEGVGGLSTVELGKQKDVYVIPGAAVPLIAAGKLDESLFDVSELVRDGYTGSTLPVIVAYTSPAAAVKAQSAHQLAAAASGQYLWSIKGLATQVNLAQGPSFFNSITVPAAPAGGSPETRAAAPLAIKPGVAKVWLDAKVHTTGADVSRTAIGADQAWAAGYQGAAAKVAILDTGIDQTHPDFAGQLAAEQNFVPAGNPGGGDPANVTDGYGHGTHVAGIIAGTGSASGGLYSGVAPKAQLVIGKVLDDDGVGDDSWIIAGMQWAATQAKIISMSLGGTPSDGTDPMSQALDSISASTGALFVVAAGNEGLSPDGNPYGGPGSCAQCIDSPGSATAALTVGAITDGCDFDFADPNTCNRNYSTDDIPYFSSTGPRLTDDAIKPDITAPGVDIPSTLAAGTGIGVPVAAYPKLYTFLSGTSMATPMVAGSAAVLLGEHPNWTAQQIRDALTSTATPNGGEPVYWQGAGMVNVGRAATQAVTGTGILDLGTAAYPQQAGSKLTGTITYTNTGPAPETLNLSSSFSTAPDNFSFQIAQRPWSPPAGAVSLPTQVTVPAGGTQSVQLSIDASQAPYFSSYGTVVATAADGSTVRTTVGFTRAALTHQLSLTAIDRTGTPVTTSTASYGYLMDLTNGQLYYVSFNNGTGTIAGTVNNELIAGRSYAFLGQIGTFGAAPYYRLQSWTKIAEPQITLNSDQSFTFDARKAGPVAVDTQRPSIGLTECLSTTRTAPDSNPPGASLSMTSCGNAATLEGEDFYALAGGQATTGTFQNLFYTHREQAPIAITARGLSAPLLPRYTVVKMTSWSGNQNAAQPRFPASARTQIADVGTGTTAEIAAAHVTGKIALLHPAVSSVTGDWSDGVLLQVDGPTAKALAAAGATGILVAPPADGVWEAWYNQADVPPIPTALLSYQEATQLSSLLAAGRGGVTVTSAWPSPHSYDLVLTQPGQTNGATYRVRDDDLAQVSTRYHSTAPGQYYSVYDTPDGVPGPSFTEDVPARAVRTEMFTPGSAFLQDRTPEVPYPDSVSLDEWLNQSLPAGHYEMNVGSGPWVPSTDLATQQSSLYLSTGTSMVSSAGYLNDLQGYDPVNTTTIVCQPPECQQVPQGDDKITGDGLYQVINDQSQRTPSFAGNPISVTTHTVWTVNVHLNATSNAVVNQPMIMTTWYVDAGLDNVVPSGRPYTVQVVPSYSDNSSHGPVTARLWATYDDGKTWVRVPGKQAVRPGQPATFVLKTPAQTNGFVGYRVQLSDADGNAINQTVIRAAFTQPSS